MRAFFEYLFYLAYKSEVRHVRLPHWSERAPYLTLARLMLAVPLLFNAFTLVVLVPALLGQPQWLASPSAVVLCALMGLGVTSLTRHYFSDEQRSTAIIQRYQGRAAPETAECTLDLLYYFGSMLGFFTTAACAYLQGLGH